MKTEKGTDGVSRCAWCTGSDGYMSYHDHEWGYPVRDDRKLFEKLSLEAFQSGLSWRTILEKREGFRAGFANFDPAAVAAFDDTDVARLLADTGVVRHRGKIEATINNAKRFADLVAEFGSFARYVWSFENTADAGDGETIRGTSPASDAMSKDLKKRGWKFVGPTTVYAFMQACGMVNDHATDCDARAKSTRERDAFERP